MRQWKVIGYQASWTKHKQEPTEPPLILLAMVFCCSEVGMAPGRFVYWWVFSFGCRSTTCEKKSTPASSSCFPSHCLEAMFPKTCLHHYMEAQVQVDSNIIRIRQKKIDTGRIRTYAPEGMRWSKLGQCRLTTFGEFESHVLTTLPLCRDCGMAGNPAAALIYGVLGLRSCTVTPPTSFPAYFKDKQ